MQQAFRAYPAECEYEKTSSAPLSRRHRLAVAGVAMVSAGAVALTPALPGAQTDRIESARADAYAMTAFENPLEVWQNTFTNLGTNVQQVSAAISAASGDLSTTLSNPALQAELAGMFTDFDPQRVLGALTNADYLDRLTAASSGASETLQAAFSGLPAVLQLMAQHINQGEFLEAFSQINVWLLVDVLGDGRGELLDAFRIPGDFLEEAGFGPLARILGATWIDEELDPQGRVGYGPGLLSRGVLGNAARGVMAPTVTAMIQTMEILDATGAAVQTGDYVSAVSHLVNAPAKITNAFLNGYVPSFIDPETGTGAIDPVTGQPYPAQAFPGIFTPTSTRPNGSSSVGGTLDFFFNQAVREIIKTLEIGPKPEAGANLRSSAAPQTAAVTEVTFGDNLIDLSVGESAPELEPAAKEPSKQAPKLDALKAITKTPQAVTAPQNTTKPGDDTVAADPADLTTDAPGSTDSSSTSKATLSKDLVSQVRETAAEKRAERAEKTRAAADKVGSSIRKGLGLPDRTKNAGPAADNSADNGPKRSKNDSDE